MRSHVQQDVDRLKFAAMHLIKVNRRVKLHGELQSCAQTVIMRLSIWNDPMASNTTCGNVVKLLLPQDQVVECA